MIIKVMLGVRWADVATIAIECHDVPDELSWEEVFHAANRIDNANIDIANLRQPWQRRLRDDIDRFGAPSMSVGDRIECFTQTGRHVQSVICEPAGWSVRIDQEATS